MKEFDPANANMLARAAFDSFMVEQRLVSSTVPSLDTVIFGRRYRTPIMMPAFSHLPVYGEGRENGMIEYARAAGALGALNWVGMGENDSFRNIMAVGTDTVRIVKPYADMAKIESQLKCAEESGAVAVGIDIDHSFSSAGGFDLVVGEDMTCLSEETLKHLAGLTSLPFVIKGVLSVRDAEACVRAGVKGIVVSHHSGRLPYAVPPIYMLPAIKKAVGDALEIFVDCSVDRGADAFKALALGANAVSVGRAMWPSLQKEGQAGLEAYVNKMNDELRMMMAFTGSETVTDIEATMLWHAGDLPQPIR